MALMLELRGRLEGQTASLRMQTAAYNIRKPQRKGWLTSPELI